MEKANNTLEKEDVVPQQHKRQITHRQDTKFP